MNSFTDLRQDLYDNPLHAAVDFHGQVQLLSKDTQIFFDFFKNKLAKTPQIYSFQEKKEAKENILFFCSYLSPFIKSFLKSSEDTALIAILNQAKLVKKMANLKIVSDKKIPILELFKSSLNKNLSDKKIEALSLWLKALRASQDKKVCSLEGKVINPYVKIHYFHRFLKSLAKIFKEVDKEAKCVNMELVLHSLDRALFEEPDPYWMRRRKEMTSVTIKGQEYIFDKLLTDAGPFIYSVKNDFSIEVVLDCNEAVRGLSRHVEKACQYTLMMPNRLGKDATGAISLIERCYNPLNEIEWTSIDTLTELDKKEAQPIIELLMHMKKQPLTPDPLDPAYFAYTKDGEMRALVFMQPLQKSFQKLEQFGWDLAKGNAFIFSYLMRTTGIAEKSEVKNTYDFKPDILKALQPYIFDKNTDFDAYISKAKAMHYPGSIVPSEFVDICKLCILKTLRPAFKPEYLAIKRVSLIDAIAKNALVDWKLVLEKNGIFNLRQQNEIINSAIKKDKY